MFGWPSLSGMLKELGNFSEGCIQGQGTKGGFAQQGVLAAGGLSVPGSAAWCAYQPGTHLAPSIMPSLE